MADRRDMFKQNTKLDVFRPYIPTQASGPGNIAPIGNVPASTDARLEKYKA